MGSITSNVAAFGVVLGGAFLLADAGSKPAAETIPAGAPDVVSIATSDVSVARDTIVLAGGCFWGVQAVFLHVNGVLGAASGYAGDGARSANYGAVSSGRTRHAESVQVVFDPSVVTLPQLLQVFFGVAHDPTTIDRQGPDVGPQYRSAIWYRNDEQRRVARGYIAQLEAAEAFGAPIVTEVAALDDFYLAEDYHQDYLVRHPRQPYIVFHDLPKLAHLERAHPALWRETAVAWNADQD